eukprot:9437462-Alexandrium_andersonii.AAC.1
MWTGFRASASRAIAGRRARTTFPLARPSGLPTVWASPLRREPRRSHRWIPSSNATLSTTAHVPGPARS